MDIKKQFGAAVKKRRKELDITQEELSMRIGLDQGYVSKIELGQMNVTLETIEQIAVALDISAGELFGVE